MFVEMRQTVKLGRFGKRTVARGDLDRHDRHGLVGQNDDLEAVRKGFVDERNLDARLFRRRAGGCGRVVRRRLIRLRRLCQTKICRNR